MIPEVFIENWRKTVPWQMTEQIQQDLMISCQTKRHVDGW
jgi:hypothetical protein